MKLARLYSFGVHLRTVLDNVIGSDKVESDVILTKLIFSHRALILQCFFRHVLGKLFFIVSILVSDIVTIRETDMARDILTGKSRNFLL